MTIQQSALLAKRVALISLTTLAIYFMGLNLLNSWNRPQIQSRLELNQTNLLLHLTEWRGEDPNRTLTVKGLLGADPIKSVQDQYQKVREQTQKTKEQTRASLEQAGLSPVQIAALQESLEKQENQLASFDLNLGILHAHQGNLKEAQDTWNRVIQRSANQENLTDLSKTAAVLAGLWSDPGQLLPNAERQIKKNLDGWFRYSALVQLYRLQQRQDALQELESSEQEAAAQSFNKLLVLSGVPILSVIFGIGLWLFLIGQWLIKRKQAILAPEQLTTWAPPWSGEVPWEVLIFGFFLGQLLLPPLFDWVWKLTGLEAVLSSDRAFAITSLGNYVLIALWSVGILYLAIRSYLPLSEDWFRITFKGNWFWWGVGGYFAAQPLVILVSLLNEKIWQGRGGSNPILPIALRGDALTLGIICITAAIAAPLFEELLFRGLLLPSLTSAVPVWGAIALSSVIFAIAHLSLSEVLPLTTLGLVLGFVYARSRNLLSSMLLHSLWNTSTLISLVVLGSGN